MQESAQQMATVLMPRAVVMNIMDRVAAEHGLTRADIIGRSRRREVVTARYAAMFAVADHFQQISYPRLARLFKRDHSTVMHAFQTRKVSKAHARNPNAGIVMKIHAGSVLSYDLGTTHVLAEDLLVSLRGEPHEKA
jgi:chromosomal replication initiation ATPase DnaA